MTHVTCRLTAKNRDQLWNPTLGNRVWATFLGPRTAFNYLVKSGLMTVNPGVQWAGRRLVD